MRRHRGMTLVELLLTLALVAVPDTFVGLAADF